MNVEKDYYATLGVLPTVDAMVLTAVYRALLKKFHPDVYSGSKADAERISKDINEAYGVLSVASRRADYDAKRGNAQGRSDDYEQEGDRGGPSRNDADDALKGNWAFVIRYHPDAEFFRRELSELSSALALAYQVTLVETKSAARAADLRTALKQQFLDRYFGNNKTVHSFVVSALHAKRRDVAAEVNRAIKLLGSPAPEAAQQFIATVCRLTGWSFRGYTEPQNEAADDKATSGRGAGEGMKATSGRGAGEGMKEEAGSSAQMVLGLVAMVMGLVALAALLVFAITGLGTLFR